MMLIHTRGLISPYAAALEIAACLTFNGFVIKDATVEKLTLLARRNGRTDKELDAAVRTLKVKYSVLAAFSGLTAPEKILYCIMSEKEEKQFNALSWDDFFPPS